MARWCERTSTPPALAKGTLPSATPFVSLYADGRLRGCFGSHEGEPATRLVRAFLGALADSRHGGVRPDERARVTAQVAYLHDAVEVRANELLGRLEVGTHGLALLGPKSTTLLLPQVARDQRLETRAFASIL